jgi:phosphohistidine phosphatase
LLLLRHAKAVPAVEPLADVARPLAERGERDARRIGERLREHGRLPDLILTSTAARALQTAQLAAAELGHSPTAIAVEQRLYLAEPATMLDVIAAQDAAIVCLLVVGHNPGLTELVHELEPSFDVDDLPTAAVVALDYPAADSWRQLKNAAARLTYYDYPKNPGNPVTRR